MPALPTRKIGDDDVAEMGLGLMGISVAYGQVENDEERFKVSVIFKQPEATHVLYIHSSSF
jgi:hypothetical protein